MLLVTQIHESTTTPTPLEPRQAAGMPPAPWAATLLGHAVLRWSGYPGRSLIGTFRRKEGRRRGGRRFRVRTPDGVELDAWHSPALPGTPRRLPVVMLHGWLEVKECHFRRAWRLNRKGHDVILFDHRAHGRSTGRHATFGVRERQDLAAVIDAASQRGYVGDRVITFGYSMGAATVLQHAPDDPRVAGVVAFAPFADLDEAVRSFRRKLAPWIDEQWLLAGFERAIRESGFGFEEASTLRAMQRIRVPVLLVEGTHDANLPPRHHTRKLLAANTHAPVQLLTINGAGHCSLCRRTWPGLNRTVTSFCASLV